MRTVLVTGGCGFIGSHFVKLLLANTDWRVVNLDALTYAGDPRRLEECTDRDRYRCVRGDIADRSLVPALFREEEPWGVVNFAAESHVDRSILDSSPFLSTNVLGLQVLLEAARRHSVPRFVHISTDEVYGDMERGGRACEASPLRPSSPYAASKASADLLCLAYGRTYGIPIMIVRSANNYGSWQFPEKLIPLMVRNALTQQSLPVYGDGRQERDWLYVTDNCEAILRVLQEGQVGAVYNVATGQEHENIEIVRALCGLLAEESSRSRAALDSLIRFVPDRPGHDRRYATDATKIRRELDWSPRVKYEDGLRGTVRWCLRHSDWLTSVGSERYSEYYAAVYSRNWGQTEDEGRDHRRQWAARG